MSSVILLDLPETTSSNVECYNPVAETNLHKQKVKCYHNKKTLVTCFYSTSTKAKIFHKKKNVFHVCISFGIR